MPRKIQDFAQQSLINPILVNVGRAGAANMDVIQEVEYVKQEAKMVYLLECLQKTPPPVIIFSDNKNEVDGEHLSRRRWLIVRYPGVSIAQGRRSSCHPR
jgi:superfamily II DNA/RNA helicase